MTSSTHRGEPVGAHPPQAGPVLVVVVDEHGDGRVRPDVVEAAELCRRLRLVVDDGHDAIAVDDEADRHDVRPAVGSHRRQPRDARAGESTSHRGDLHPRPRYRSRVGDVGGLVLTGGSSRRFGVDKAMLLVDGERLADRALRVLGAVRESRPRGGPRVRLGGCRARGPARRRPARRASSPVGTHSAAALHRWMPSSCSPSTCRSSSCRVLEWLARHPTHRRRSCRSSTACRSRCARATPPMRWTSPVICSREANASMRALLDAVPVHAAPRRRVDRGRRPRDAFADVDTPEDATALGCRAAQVAWPRDPDTSRPRRLGAQARDTGAGARRRRCRGARAPRSARHRGADGDPGPGARARHRSRSPSRCARRATTSSSRSASA